MGLFTKDIKTMDDLFLHTLQDIYYAENKIVKSLPDMIANATDGQLKSGLKSHLGETKGHVQRLEQVFQMLGKKAKSVDCPAIDGIIGIDFAHEIDLAVADLANCDRLILDLRGNPGGGIGGLRLMSYLTPDKRPVGYSLTRQRAVRGYRREELPRLEGIPSAKWP